MGSRGANGSPHAPALSVRDAPTINSLIARAAPRPAHARVDALLERLSAPAPVSPHSVIVHSRAAPTPSPPSSNEVIYLFLLAHSQFNKTTNLNTMNMNNYYV